MAPVPFQDCRGLFVSVVLLSQCRWLARQGAWLKIHCMVSPGRWLMILSFRARQQNPFRNYLSLRTGWIHFLETPDVSPTGLRDESLDEFLWNQAVRSAFPLGMAVWDHHSLSPGISHVWKCHCWELAGLGSSWRGAAPHLVPAWKTVPDFTLSSGYSSPLIMALADLAEFLISS